ncbi:MAG: hypothetical protein MR902_01845 [Campylobacter sp.]|nr:hypothetical protein [Campylobacter sp.]
MSLNTQKPPTKAVPKFVKSHNYKEQREYLLKMAYRYAKIGLNLDEFYLAYEIFKYFDDNKSIKILKDLGYKIDKN